MSVKVTLYFAGNARKSEDARKLVVQLKSEINASVVYDFVDVLKQPGRGITAGLVATPTIIIEHNGVHPVYVGKLPPVEQLRAAAVKLHDEPDSHD